MPTPGLLKNYVRRFKDNSVDYIMDFIGET